MYNVHADTHAPRRLVSDVCHRAAAACPAPHHNNMAGRTNKSTKVCVWVFVNSYEICAVLSKRVKIALNREAKMQLLMNCKKRFRMLAQVMVIGFSFPAISHSDQIFTDHSPMAGWVRITSTQTWVQGTLLLKSTSLRTPFFDFDDVFYQSRNACELALLDQVCPQDLIATASECSIVNVGDQRVLRIDPVAVPMGEIGVTRTSYCQEVFLQVPKSASSAARVSFFK